VYLILYIKYPLLPIIGSFLLLLIVKSSISLALQSTPLLLIFISGGSSITYLGSGLLLLRYSSNR